MKEALEFKLFLIVFPGKGAQKGGKETDDCARIALWNC